MAIWFVVSHRVAPLASSFTCCRVIIYPQKKRIIQNNLTIERIFCCCCCLTWSRWLVVSVPDKETLVSLAWSAAVAAALARTERRQWCATIWHVLWANDEFIEIEETIENILQTQVKAVAFLTTTKKNNTVVVVQRHKDYFWLFHLFFSIYLSFFVVLVCVYLRRYMSKVGTTLWFRWRNLFFEKNKTKK